MKRSTFIKGAVVAVTAVVAAGPLAWAPGAVAQQQPMAKEIEGTVKSLDGGKLTLADGTELMIPASANIARTDLKPGAAVKVSYEEQGGQKVVRAIQVQK